MNVTRAVVQRFKGIYSTFNAAKMCQISDFLYLFIAAILWAVPHLSSRLRTETKRAQNHNWKESGDHILEVQWV